MENEKRSASPRWYRNTAIIFFAIAAVLVWAAVAKHDWVYWAFAGITLLNAVLTTLKFLMVRESGK